MFTGNFSGPWMAIALIFYATHHPVCGTIALFIAVA